MTFNLENLIISLEKVDLDDIFSDWRWRINDPKGLIFISKLGDMFLLGNDDSIYWLRTDDCQLTKVAENLKEFEFLINQEENLDNWFLPDLISRLEAAGKVLGPNEVYSYKQMPAIGGDYSVDNLEPTDISVHFTFSGQICQQIQNLPDGTRVKFSLKKG